MSYMNRLRGTTADEPAALLLDLVLRQVHATATGEQEHAFLVAIGSDLAARFPLGNNEDLAALEERINDAWDMLDLGTATITLADDAILIRHRLPAAGVNQNGGLWRTAMPAIIEGAYDAWLRAMGSGPRLITTLTARTADVVEYRHGL